MLFVIVLVTIGFTDSVLTLAHRRIVTGSFKSVAVMAAEEERIYRMPSEIFHHGLRPMARTDRARWGPNIYSVRTNSLGFRDREVRVVAPRAEKYRILFIGDSFTEGFGFDYEKTFVGVIDDALKECGVEVLNAGVSSYAPVLYLKRVQHLIDKQGLEFHDLVVYLDISDVVDEVEYANPVDQGDFLETSPSKSQSMRRWIHSNTTLVYRAGRLTRNLLFPRRAEQVDHALIRRERWTTDAEVYKEYGEPGLDLARRHMDQLHQLVSQHGIHMTIAVYPWPAQILAGEVPSIQVRIWRDWAAERHVAFINYFPAFIGDRPPKDVVERFFIPGDVHWNAHGHRLVAEGFLERFRDDARRTHGTRACVSARPTG